MGSGARRQRRGRHGAIRAEPCRARRTMRPRPARAAPQFQVLCIACHGAEGNGNPLFGAPDLTNDIWLYGGDADSIAFTVRNGRNGQMPNFGARARRRPHRHRRRVRVRIAAKNERRPNRQLIATDAASRRTTLATAGFAPVDLYQRREKIFTRTIEGRFQRMRLVLRLAAAARVPAAAVARLGRPAGRAVRSADAALLHFRSDVLAAGFHAARVAADHRGVRACSPSRRWSAASGAATRARRRSGPRSSCGWSRSPKGARHARIRLDQAPWTSKKSCRRGAKHALWLGWAFLTGFTFVGYFTPIRALAVDVVDVERRRVGGRVDRLLHARDLHQRRLDARAGVHLHVSRTRASSRRCSTRTR